MHPTCLIRHTLVYHRKALGKEFIMIPFILAVDV